VVGWGVAAVGGPLVMVAGAAGGVEGGRDAGDVGEGDRGVAAALAVRGEMLWAKSSEGSSA
jgi:hypothetical protein